MELIIPDFNPKLFVGDTIIATFALESRVSWFFSGFDPPEERLQSQINPNLDILKNLRIDLLKLRSFGFPGYKYAVGFI
jgi:hypothetical protein